MSKKITFLLSILLPLQLFSQSFEKTFSPGNATSIVQRDDSSFVAAIFMVNHGLMEISPTGDSISYKEFSYCAFEKIIKSYGNCFLATGTFIGAGNGACLVRLDNSLDTIWMKIFPSGFTSRGKEIIELPDSSILLTISANGGMSSFECSLVYLDKDGNILWQTNPSFSYFTDNSITVEHSLVYRAVNLDSDVLELTCYDLLNGDTVWNKQYNSISSHGMSFTPHSSSILVSDSGLYIAGNVTQDSAGTITNQQMIFKTDFNGDSIWLQTYLSGNFAKIISTSPVNYFCAGRAPNDSTVLISLDAQGTPVWSKNYCLYDKSYPWDLILNSDSGFAFCGLSYQIANTTYYTYVVRTDSLGNIDIINTLAEAEDLSIRYEYNRNDQQLRINLETFDKPVSAEIYSIDGRLLTQELISDKNNMIDLQSLAHGTYIVVLRNNKVNISQHKFLVY